MGETSNHSKPEKDKARKRGRSLKGKTIELGNYCNTFAALVYWDPTHRQLEHALHLPEGQTIPDLNKFVRTPSLVFTVMGALLMRMTVPQPVY